MSIETINAKRHREMMKALREILEKLPEVQDWIDKTLDNRSPRDKVLKKRKYTKTKYPEDFKDWWKSQGKVQAKAQGKSKQEAYKVWVNRQLS